MTPVSHSQPPIPRQPIGTTFAVSIGILGFVLAAQMLAVAWFFLPKLRQQFVDSATVDAVQPAAAPVATPAPDSGTATETPQQPDAAMVQRINRLVNESDSAYRVGDFEGALAKLDEADSLLPDDPGILLRRARAFESVQQPGPAAEIYTRVLALPNLSPELRAQSARKLEQLGEVAATRPQTTPMMDEVGADVRDDTGLQPGSNLGIVDTRLRDGNPGTKALRVAIKSRPGSDIDTRQMKLHVFFYEQDEAGDVQLTESKVVSQWISPPVNWADNEPELLDVTYILPDSDLPGSALSNGLPGRTYAGYIVGVYYNNELQDTRAEPGTLAKRFPLPLYLKQENQ
ncbi:MAG: tetratricopeptide repeat protein [Terrimicrobiaceae bacterium]|nr:tetratricopeptide repeat protein [Terrimicrobiaceae bacterium]